MMLDLRKDYFVARLQEFAAPTVGHQVDALRRPAGVDDLAIRGGVDQGRNLLAGVFVSGSRLLAQTVHAAADGSIAFAVKTIHGVDDGHRLLRGRGAVEIVE